MAQCAVRSAQCAVQGSRRAAASPVEFLGVSGRRPHVNQRPSTPRTRGSSITMSARMPTRRLRQSGQYLFLPFIPRRRCQFPPVQRQRNADAVHRPRAPPCPATDNPQPSPSVLARPSGRPSPQSHSAMPRPTPRPTRTSRIRCSRSTCSSGTPSAQQQRPRSPPTPARLPRSRRRRSATAPPFPSPRRCSTPSA